MNPSPALIDVHAHFVTDDYVDAARRAGQTHPDGIHDYPSWNPDAHVELMDRCGIRTAILSLSSPGVHFGDDHAAGELARQVNDFAAATVRAHPGRFGHFASVPLPDVDGARAEAAYALDELGSDGLVVFTNARGVYLGDERFDRLWADLDRRRAVVFVHPTSPCGHETISLGRPRPMLEFIFDAARAASDLVLGGTLTRFPEIQWVFPHGGGALPLVADRIEAFRTLFLAGDPAGPTTVEQIRRLWFDIAGTPFPNQVPALVAAFGDERVLYGSDYCWTPAPIVDEQVASIDAAAPPPDGSWRQLTTRNAHRLLSLPETAR